MSQRAKFVGDVDFSKLCFGNFQNKDGKQSVEVWADASNTTNKNKPKFQLCQFVDEPNEVRFPLDPIRYDATGKATNEDRRGIKVKLTPAQEASLLVLDMKIVAAAVKNSKEWFKKELTEEQVMLRYHPVVHKAVETDDFNSMGFKVKTGNSSWPTTLNLMLPNGKFVENGGKISHIDKGVGIRVAPILSAFSIWFMGGGAQFGISFSCDKMVVSPGTVQTSMSEFTSRAPVEIVQAEENDVTLEEEDEEGPPEKKARVEEDDVPAM